MSLQCTTAELAEHLGVSRNRISNIIRRRKVICTKELGRRATYNLDEIRAVHEEMPVNKSPTINIEKPQHTKISIRKVDMVHVTAALMKMHKNHFDNRNYGICSEIMAAFARIDSNATQVIQ